MLTKVKDSPNLARDNHSNAIISVDNNGYAAYRKQREIIRARSREVESKVKYLEDEINNLRTIITQYLESNNGHINTHS